MTTSDREDQADKRRTLLNDAPQLPCLTTGEQLDHNVRFTPKADIG